MNNNDRFILSFIDKSVSITSFEKQTHASIRSGFKFSKFEKRFEELGFNNLPDFVVNILEKNGYKRDFKLNMWVVKTQGSANLAPDDEYNETTGRRIALMRAKEKAYKKACQVFEDLDAQFYFASEMCGNTLGELYDFTLEESDAIERVIETGKSDRN